MADISQVVYDKLKHHYIDTGLEPKEVADRMDSIARQHAAKVAKQEIGDTVKISKKAKVSKKTANAAKNGASMTEKFTDTAKEKITGLWNKIKTSSFGKKIATYTDKLANIVKKHPIGAIGVTALAVFLGTKLLSGNSETSEVYYKKINN